MQYSPKTTSAAASRKEMFNEPSKLFLRTYSALFYVSVGASLLNLVINCWILSLGSLLSYSHVALAWFSIISSILLLLVEYEKTGTIFWFTHLYNFIFRGLFILLMASSLHLLAFEKDIDSTLYLRTILSYVLFADGAMHVVFGSICFQSIKSYQGLLKKKWEEAVRNGENEATTNNSKKKIVDIEKVIRETEIKLQHL